MNVMILQDCIHLLNQLDLYSKKDIELRNKLIDFIFDVCVDLIEKEAIEEEGRKDK